MEKFFTIFILVGAAFNLVACETEEPCKNSDDMMKCIRDYFHENGQCNVIEEADDEPAYFEGKHNAYVSKINTTFGLSKLYISRMNGMIETFHINKDTGNLVMSVEFEGVQLESKEVHFRISQRSKEPIVIKEYANGIYPVILTAVLPATEITGDKLLSSFVSAFVPSPYPAEFTIGPKIMESEDPAVALVVQEMLANIPTVLQELFLTGAPDIFIVYLQKYICDFGVSLPY